MINPNIVDRRVFLPTFQTGRHDQLRADQIEIGMKCVFRKIVDDPTMNDFARNHSVKIDRLDEPETLERQRIRRLKWLPPKTSKFQVIAFTLLEDIALPEENYAIESRYGTVYKLGNRLLSPEHTNQSLTHAGYVLTFETAEAHLEQQTIIHNRPISTSVNRNSID